jgi:phenylacetate-CoA ligase
MSLLGYARFYAIDFMRGTKVLETIDELQSEQYKSWQELLSISDEKYSRLLKHAIKYVPFYNQYNSDEKFPILTKDLIRHNVDQLKSLVYRGRLEAKSTGGSTGLPLRYFTTTKAQSFMWAGIIHSWKVVGYELGDRVAFIAGTAIAKKNFKHDIFYSLMNVEIYSAFDLREETIYSYLNDIKKKKVKVIYGYPTAINIIANYLNKNPEIRPPSLKGIVVTSEVLEEKHRVNIQKAFQVPVRNQYGCNEAAISAFECEHGNMHLINTATKIDVDAEGNLLASNLVNEGFVLINYTTGDKIKIHQINSCPCKRGYPIISDILGRTVDIIVDQEGKIFHSAFFSILFRQDSSVEQFQIQYNEDEIELHLKVIEELPYQILYEKYINKVKEHLKFEKYSLFINEPFLLSSNAKHRYVIDNRLNK